MITWIINCVCLVRYRKEEKMDSSMEFGCYLFTPRKVYSPFEGEKILKILG